MIRVAQFDDDLNYLNCFAAVCTTRNVFGGVLYEGKEALEDSQQMRMSIGMTAVWPGMIECALGENGKIVC